MQKPKAFHFYNNKECDEIYIFKISEIDVAVINKHVSNKLGAGPNRTLFHRITQGGLPYLKPAQIIEDTR